MFFAILFRNFMQEPQLFIAPLIEAAGLLLALHCVINKSYNECTFVHILFDKSNATYPLVLPQCDVGVLFVSSQVCSASIKPHQGRFGRLYIPQAPLRS